MPSPRPLQNRHRTSTFTLPENHEQGARLFLAAVIGALFFHIILFALLQFFGIGLNLHQLPLTEEILPLEQIVIKQTHDEDAPEIEAPPPEIPAIPHEKDIEMPDIVDLPLEQLVIAPGETSISMPDSAPAAIDLPIVPDSIDVKQIQSGVADSMPDPAIVTANDITIKAPVLDEENPKQWENTDIAGDGGLSDGISQEGSVSLQNLLNRPSGSLGAGSGFSIIGADLLFEFDKAMLKKTALKDLITLAALIEKNNDTRFIIEGHTDSFGSELYNKKLSFYRANAVRQWLSDMGIPLDRVFIRACGADRLIASALGNREQQSSNRRVEIHMRKSSEPLPQEVHLANAPLPQFIEQTTQNGESSPPSPQSAKKTPPESTRKAEIIDDTPPPPPVVPAEIIEDTSTGAEVVE